VIPKQELEHMDQYDDMTVAHCMVVAKNLMRNMKIVMSDIHFVYLAVEGIEVPHWHIHLIPYIHGLVFPHVSRLAYDAGEQQQYLNLLQTNLSD
jgi:diadenosine tetraphosphate (Ap4A) HIT family hydrolase